jgi:hypothetical protein
MKVSALCLLLGLALLSHGALAEDGPVAGPDWLEVPAQSLEITAGNPLDFSNLTPSGAAGGHGPVIIGAGGRFAFAADPASPAHLSCMAISTGENLTQGFPTHDEADRFARQVRAHGYNIVRLHFSDERLMNGRQKDFDYDPQQLDRYRYLMAALKKEGIYWIVDVMTSPRGARGSENAKRDDPADSMKLKVYYDSEAQAHWKRMAQTILGTVNPYTGLTPLKDPALAMVVEVNEGSLGFIQAGATHRGQPAFPVALAPKFNAWLLDRYKSTSALATAWGDLSPSESLERNSVAFPPSWDARGHRMRDALEFVSGVETETFDWMRNALNDLGYNGPITSYDSWLPSAGNLTRSHLPVVDMHIYVGDTPSYAPGTKWSQTSSIADGLRDYRTGASARWLGRPFTITEYGQPFPSQYRFEAGLVFPAMAALQGWDFICRHAHLGIESHIQSAQAPRPLGIRPFSIGLDPIARAGETLAALLFYRGDVRQGPGTIAVPYGKDESLRASGFNYMPKELSSDALLTRYGLVPSDNIAAAGPDALIAPMDSSSPQSTLGIAVTKLIALAKGTAEERLTALVANLKSAGIMAKDNITDANRPMLQSATGELTLDVPQGVGIVRTPRTEAISFMSLPQPVAIGALSVQRSSGPALISASTLDNAPLATSNRILLIFATDAANSKMKFDDTAHTIIRDWGSLPILLRRGTIDISLKVQGYHSAKLYALALNGDKTGALPVTGDNGEIRATLDSGAISGKPTTFFYLEVER